ncbi:CinA family protein [Flavisolibacter ginsenosidimutans]|nr:CinA family protein [Flavisolibacter ginsenosidimutans]
MFNRQALDELRDSLLGTRQTIAVAESVTSGFLQAAFSTVPDAASFFHGGITAYNLGQKYRHLRVDPIHAEDCNCVSEQVAATMALEVCQLFSSHWGVAITGYATKVPEGGNELHAFYAVAHKGKVVEEAIVRANTKEGVDAQLYFVNEVLKALQKQIKEPAAKRPSVS